MTIHCNFGPFAAYLLEFLFFSLASGGTFGGTFMDSCGAVEHITQGRSFLCWKPWLRESQSRELLLGFSNNKSPRQRLYWWPSQNFLIFITTESTVRRILIERRILKGPLQVKVWSAWLNRPLPTKNSQTVPPDSPTLALRPNDKSANKKRSST